MAPKGGAEGAALPEGEGNLTEGGCFASIYYNTVLDGCLFVRYRNHFPVVQFQNQAHIWNPHGKGQDFKTIWGAAGSPIIIIFYRRSKWGAEGATILFS